MLVDLINKTYNISLQEIFTVKVDAIVNYFIRNPFGIVVKIQDGNLATCFLALTDIRNVVGTKKLVSLLSEKDGICRVGERKSR